jgi:hypothetical protein
MARYRIGWSKPYGAPASATWRRPTRFWKRSFCHSSMRNSASLRPTRATPIDRCPRASIWTAFSRCVNHAAYSTTGPCVGRIGFCNYRRSRPTAFDRVRGSKFVSSPMVGCGSSRASRSGPGRKRGRAVSCLPRAGLDPGRRVRARDFAPQRTTPGAERAAAARPRVSQF